MKSHILGQSYILPSVNAACDRMVNLFPEAIPGEGKEAGWVRRAPGLKFRLSIGHGPVRQLYSKPDLAGGMYGVVGEGFYVTASLDSAAQLIGLVTGSGPGSVADNGTQIFLACNPDGYIYNTQTQAFQKIIDPDFTGAGTVTYLDGYFIYNEPGTQKIWVTSLLDGTSVDPLDFASAEGSPDSVQAVIANNGQLWVFGTESVEVWYNTGSSDFPFSRIQGAFNEIGCAAPYSVCKLSNTLFWLGSDERGKGIVYRTNGYRGERVSNHSIEAEIQDYEVISDAFAYAYQQGGHEFYVLTFPTANRTWVYDANTLSWHERSSFIHSRFIRHRSNCHTNFEGKSIVGDFINGDIYELDLHTYSDNGQPQKWLRSWRALPQGENNLTRTAQHSLQLDCESGVGVNIGQGSDPQVVLRWSDDGGHTWSNEHWRTMGRIGKTGTRVIWRRLGMTEKLRDRVYEVSGTDPVKIAIMGAEILLSGTSS